MAILKSILKLIQDDYGQTFKAGKSMKSVYLVSCLMVIASASFSVSAEKYYKWVDKDGGTHYSANPPRDISTTIVKVKADSSVTSTDQSDSSGEESQQSDGSRLTENFIAEQTHQVEAESEEQRLVQRTNCATANRKLTALENAGRIRQLDEQSGEYRYLPNQDKLAEMSKMRKYLRSNCVDR